MQNTATPFDIAYENISFKYITYSLKKEVWGKEISMRFGIFQFTSVGPYLLLNTIISKDTIYVSEACVNYLNY